MICDGALAFNDCMLIIYMWVLDVDKPSLETIPLWVKIRGIPLQFLISNVIYHIGDRQWKITGSVFQSGSNIGRWICSDKFKLVCRSTPMISEKLYWKI